MGFFILFRTETGDSLSQVYIAGTSEVSAFLKFLKDSLAI